MSDRVQIEVKNGVADVRLDRPDKMNALDGAMFAAIAEAGETVAGDPSVRAVVLSGVGRAFCSGLDFSSFQAMAGDGGSRPERSADGEREPSAADMPEGRITHLGQQVAHVWQEVEVPVIAAVHGVALGGGCQIAMGADIRIIAPDARMSVLEIKWGLIPDVGITQTLRDVVSLDVAKELTWTGRVLDGPAAKELGIVTHVTETPLEDALALAHDIASKSPDAIRRGKQLLEESWYADAQTGLELESRLQGELIGSPNQIESVKAGFEKRAPVYQNPTG